MAGSLDGDHVYAADVYGTAVMAFSRNAGTGEVTLVESVADVRTVPPRRAGPFSIFLLAYSAVRDGARKAGEVP